MIDIIKEKKKNRFLFLKKMYEAASGSTDFIFEMQELGSEIGFRYEETSQIVDYLCNENLIEPYGMGGTIHLTHWGIKEMEQALDNPEKPTEHFLPINIINIGSMSNSSVQQATHNSTINQNLDIASTTALKSLIGAIEEFQKTILLSVELKEELISEIETLKSQQRSPKPKSIIVRESLKTIRNILEGIAGNAFAPAVIDHISQFLHHL